MPCKALDRPHNYYITLVQAPAFTWNTHKLECYTVTFIEYVCLCVCACARLLAWSAIFIRIVWAAMVGGGLQYTTRDFFFVVVSESAGQGGMRSFAMISFLGNTKQIMNMQLSS